MAKHHGASDLRLLLTMVVSGDEDDQGGHHRGCRKPRQALGHDDYCCVTVAFGLNVMAIIAKAKRATAV
jgi:hypothetical protein